MVFIREFIITVVLKFSRTGKFIVPLLIIGALTVIIVHYEYKAVVKVTVMNEASLIHTNTARLWVANHREHENARLPVKQLLNDDNAGNFTAITTPTTAAKVPVSYAIYTAHTPNGKVPNNRGGKDNTL